jgi:hypothetical protein
MVEISSEPGAEIIHHSNRVTQLNQSLDQRRPDEPSAAGHKKTCHATSLARIFGRMPSHATTHIGYHSAGHVSRGKTRKNQGKNQDSGFGIQETALLSLKSGICHLELTAAIKNTVVINHKRLVMPKKHRTDKCMPMIISAVAAWIAMGVILRLFLDSVSVAPSGGD